jgi:glycosyltransferase involved in cell wall biosynthesis
MLSVIVSVFNEEKNPYLLQILTQFENEPFFELICVDGGSSDNTQALISKHHATLHVLEHSTRAARLNLGIQHATHPRVLLYHPRSRLSSEAICFLKTHHAALDWAAFTHQFDHAHFFLKFISWYSNHVRVQKKNIVYLDHCMVINKAYLNAQAIPDIAIFEDTALSHSLQSHGKPTLLPHIATTSAIRFLDRGIFKHFFLNQVIKALYHLGINPKKINKLYEQHLNLNQNN